MNESVRTLIFVGLAMLSLLVASFAGPARPKPPTEYSNIRGEFFPDFKDASAAKSLTLVSYNPDQGEIRVFGVEQGSDQVWRIPTRNNYPVDGKDRLSKTATSVIGIKRETVAGTRKSQHAEFGVLDPNAGKVSDFKGIGNRIILKDGKDGKTLADLIIGKEVKGRSGYYYVRNPNEDQTYIAKVKIDVSTKFADWIEPDLLKLDATKLQTVVIDKHSIEIKNGRGSITGEETNKLTRTSATDKKWKLDGLDDATEEVNEDEVRKLVQALDDLKIVGVRPKSERLKKAFQADKGMTADQRTQMELGDMGFFFVPTQNGRGAQLISQEGDVLATTDQGVVYDLHFGSIFTGTEAEVEAGFIGSDGEPKEGEPKDGEKKAEDKKDGEPADKAEDSKSKKIKSRYFFATASFDADAIGPKPTAPVKPEPPTEDAKKPDDDAADAAAADNAVKEDPKKAYEAALAAYEGQVKKHEADVKTYDDKVAAGKKQVKELNRRFSEWYYVISGDSFEELRQGRKTLVKPKGAPAGEKAGDLLKRDAQDLLKGDAPPDQN